MRNVADFHLLMLDAGGSGPSHAGDTCLPMLAVLETQHR